jgi:DNA-binding NtrC family response regulator
MNPQKITVLLVDDEVEFTSNLLAVLSRRGFSVDTVSDGLSAVSCIAKKHYDVVVLDIKMPGMSGVRVLSEIMRITPSTRVILLTGHFSAADEEDSLKSGAFAYLLKPYPILKLVDVISAAAGRGAGSPSEGLRPSCPF